MGIFKTLTPEQEAQGALNKEVRLREKERQREAQAAERQRQQELKERAEFMAGPAGKARSAFDRGDLIYQANFNLLNQEHAVVPMINAFTLAKTSDPTVVLNAICREGWDLHNSGFAFLHEGEESRDKFLASGQHVAIRGKMMGYYVFKRCGQNRVRPEENTSKIEQPRTEAREVSSQGGLLPTI